MACVKQDGQEKIQLCTPGINQQTPVMKSPGFVQLSTAAAITLGLTPGMMYRNACTHCLNLLLTYPEGCRANCSYCGLARHREEARDYADRNFIRVDWPTVAYEEIIDKVNAGDDKACFERMCISMITHPDANRDTLLLLEEWVRHVPHIPVSILSNPTSMDRNLLVQMREKGAEIFTVALDAATPGIFNQTRGKAVESPHRWKHYWQVIEWAEDIFGAERFGVHLICGMGETEKELLEIVQTIVDRGGHSHLFAFFPEQGSLMEDWDAVPHEQWRRVQLARFLIDYRGVKISQMRFNSGGQLVSFGLPGSELSEIIDSGKPFQTSGCPGKSDPEISACNRPFGDSSPSDIRSYPFCLDDSDLVAVKHHLE
jgi:biotin synthase